MFSMTLSHGARGVARGDLRPGAPERGARGRRGGRARRGRRRRPRILQGTAMHVEPMKSMLKPHGTERLKLKYDHML